MSLGFTVFSILVGAWILSGKGIWKGVEQWRLFRISSCFFYFAMMEFLQFVQYLVIDDCGNSTNIFWTALGWLHICWQPLFSNYAFSALDPKNRHKQRDDVWRFIHKFCFTSGLLMALRLIIPAIIKDASVKAPTFFKMCTEEIEGVCGERTCTETGKYHLKWSFKMIKPSYPFPSLSVHFLNMFIAPIIMGQALGSVVLFISGPLIALMFDASHGERASIWCFFSIMETALTAFTQYMACRMSIKKADKKN